MQIEKVKLSTIKANPNNPRVIKDYAFNKLVKSIQEFPEMLEIRPIVVNDEMIVLGGNMRLRACQEAGLKEVPIIKASQLTEEQQKEFIIKDNVSFGDWDYDQLANEWSDGDLSNWGMELSTTEFEGFSETESSVHTSELPYTMKIEAPIYEPKGEKPELEELVNIDKYNEKLLKIEEVDAPDDVKDFLRKSATRLIEFNYSKIAEYYAHSEKNIQEIMEDLGLVIIDFNSAIEKGYVGLSNYILDNYIDEYETE